MATTWTSNSTEPLQEKLSRAQMESAGIVNRLRRTKYADSLCLARSRSSARTPLHCYTRESKNRSPAPTSGRASLAVTRCALCSG